MLMRRAASRLKARKPLVASATVVPDTLRTTQEPTPCSLRLLHEKWATACTSRSPTTMSASPRRMGATRVGIWCPGYWWSASVLTMTSAPSRRQASRPAMKPAASPLRRVNRTTWSAPWARATSAVPSVDPSSMIRTSTTSIPSMARGMAAIVAGSVACSFRQGIWTMSFMRKSAEESRSWTRETVAQGPEARLTRSRLPLHCAPPGGVEAELRHVVQDRGRSRAARAQRVLRPRCGGGGSGGQGGSDAPESVVHGRGRRQRRDPARDLQQRALARAVGPEVESGGVDLHRPRPVAAVEVEEEAWLEARRAGEAQPLRRRMLANDGALHDEKQAGRLDLDRARRRARV